MTAETQTPPPRFVDGVQVVSDLPTRSALPQPDKQGNPIMMTQIRTLALADGRVIGGCAHCDYTHPSPNGIRPHLRIHKTAPVVAANGFASMTVAELLTTAHDVQGLAEDRDRWKTRAQVAEKQLAQLRRALRGISE